jgi:hypothetical protein
VLLQRIVETAAGPTGARYAALGVLDCSGQTLERFLTRGVDEETHAAIGELPRGRGILGVLIREHQPLRLHEISDDPRSVGFPRNHPPMKTFSALLLAAQAAVAIENARLYESSTRWLRQFETLNEIGNALASQIELEPLLGLVARRLRELIDAQIVLIALPEPGQGTLRVAAAEGEGAYGLAGMSLPPHRPHAGDWHRDRADGTYSDDSSEGSGFPRRRHRRRPDRKSQASSRSRDRGAPQ